MHDKVALTERLAEALDIPSNELVTTTSQQCTNCKDLERLVALMKEKLKIVTKKRAN